MRVLLINPPYPVCEGLTMPLGLLYLASRLEEDGHHVVLEDLQLCRAPLRHLRARLSRLDPQVVGVTSFSLNLSDATRILRAAKEACPEAFTVWGGPHVSFHDEGILRGHPWVDAVVRGEGEETLAQVVSRVGEEKGLPGVEGVTWRDSRAGIRVNPPRPFREDLDGLPRPAWHLLPLSKYRAFGDGASLMTSRGCPHRCAFCVGRKMIGQKGRFRRPEAVVDEMEALANMGFRGIRVEDDLFTFKRERVMAICRELDQRAMSIRWRAYARVDTVDRELLDRMKRAGCERLLFGAESGSPEILRRIRKRITPEQTRGAVLMTREAGIGVLASFVLGLPGETPETLRQTLEFAESLGVPYTLNLLTPYMGTEVRERADEMGIRILSHDWRLYGQGKPLTATPRVGPWHLSRAVGRYRRRLSQYLAELLEAERLGRLGETDAEELRQHRRGAFLRRLVSEDLVERWGSVLPGEGRGPLDGFALRVAREIGVDEEEVKANLLPLIQEGHLKLTHRDGDGSRWDWA
jgi:radical SAM superfamily enzyme YgiQ (UPF0313 family)